MTRIIFFPMSNIINSGIINGENIFLLKIKGQLGSALVLSIKVCQFGLNVPRMYWWYWILPEARIAVSRLHPSLLASSPK